MRAMYLTPESIRLKKSTDMVYCLRIGRNGHHYAMTFDINSPLTRRK